MAGHFLPDFSDRSQHTDKLDGRDNAAVRLVQQIHHAGARSAEGWDRTPLEVACRTITGSHGSIPRIHSVFPCPPGPGGAIPVVEYSRALAANYGLNVHCTLSGGMITVTFGQTEASK